MSQYCIILNHSIFFLLSIDTDIDFTDDSKMKISDNIILIVSISAVVIVCVLALIILVAVILYRKGEHVILIHINGFKI